jgi:REP-associated tyrosine transposase
MPDHLHLFVEALHEHSDFRRFAKMSKQRSGASHALSRKERLWQEGYWEKVLRLDEDPRPVVRYVFENPVRANLVRTPRDYPFLGSDVWNLTDIL